jgi:hypothetical protein
MVITVGSLGGMGTTKREGLVRGDLSRGVLDGRLRLDNVLCWPKVSLDRDKLQSLASETQGHIDIDSSSYLDVIASIENATECGS